MAVCRAAALDSKFRLYRLHPNAWRQSHCAIHFACAMMNVVNGGAHSTTM